jgi:segregation and condensation protein B
MTEPNGVDVVQESMALLPPSQRLRAAGALLFVADEPVAVSTLARHLGSSQADTRQVLTELSQSLSAIGLVLQWMDDAHVQLGTAPDLATILRQFLGQERTIRLSQAALETVALIGYRQPVTRSEIEAVRGVDSSGVLQTLLARGLIEPVGRLPVVGSPLLYATAPEFLRLFGLTSLRDLPELPDNLISQIEERSTTDDADSDAAS